MRNNPVLAILIFTSIIAFIDIYSYTGITRIGSKLSNLVLKAIKIFHWIIPAVLITGLLIIMIFRNSVDAADQIRVFHFFSGYFLLFYIPKLVFIFFKFIEDIIRLTAKLGAKKITNNEPVNSKLNKISRAQFLSRVGIITAGIPFASIIYGIGIGRFDFTVRNVPLKFANLPDAFNGIKLVQISDFHIGSFLNHPEKVEEAIELINAQNADLLVFTGDMVNNVSSELERFSGIMKRLKARYGMYSVLGNHDYGEYVPWENESARNDNMRKLVEIQDQIGFKLLLNSSDRITIGEEKIALVGVENWGLPPFPQYGDLKKALENINEDEFKILLSHDPTHWDEQVLGKTNVDLTLSGHTHGAQFGIEIPGWRWSPVNIRYKRWGGLYEENEQKLYVNTGIGFIGFPGRVGMPPEITVFELNKEFKV